MKHPYSYVILRYVHDIVSGEQLNVGVVVYSPKAQYLGASCRPTFQRLSHAFPGLHGDAFKSVSRFIQAEIERLSETIKSQLPFDAAQPAIGDIVTRVLPNDASSFQWSEPGMGVSSDLAQTVDELYERFVTRYDEHPSNNKHRTDEDVWKHYRRDLEKRQVLKYLKPKQIAAANVEFPYAWKNGTWRCLEPVSFDLGRADNIQDKAHKELGKLLNVDRSKDEPVKVYLLVGKPQSPEVADAFEKALQILELAPGDTEIVTEDKADAFVDSLAKEIEAHENLAHH